METAVTKTTGADAHVLVQYTRDKNRQKTGVLMAFAEDGVIKLGLSKWKKNPKEPIFETKVGLKIARERALKWANLPSRFTFPESMKDDVQIFIDRATRYFKDVTSFPVRDADPEARKIISGTTDILE